MYMYARNIDSACFYDSDVFVIVYFISILLFLLYRSIYLSQKVAMMTSCNGRSGIRRKVIKESINDGCIGKYKSIYHTGMSMTAL